MTSAAATAYVALGANIDDPITRVEEAIGLLDAEPFGRIVARSSLYRSAPIGLLDQPDFINAVLALQTTLAPLDLLRELLGLEHRLGRVRSLRNGPRRIDLDLIEFAGRRLHLPSLQLPHPRARERAFVLLPLAEIAPDLELGGESVVRLAERVSRQCIARIEA